MCCQPLRASGTVRQPDPAVVPLGNYREQMVATRLAALDRPGIYLDRSPTGSGKSHVDRRVLAHMLLGGEAA